ncbi:F1F0-ATPase inhibitor protein [Arabidopsis thaliana]|uniref:At5g04750 n=1 Tax=Arabidopsis thaliana TaxID=3702 RepID=Q84W11_ARATH|nr:F1F0-ATPase inhibitor protein [Arabidopsis thaliana]AAO42805.1 At5g04750 [Arabidopsis thaliana]AED90779.1 F1F0-ATPase inhibitor protein [Arabidopsis thaliana]BAE99323.1 F1F0-ATPase inhibitor-like protein [Arabidopsis thaliana]|eukprot:NP_568140.2 F1F0-ATPase inhibitor protein [Arabidopsis thaliana]
MSSARSAITKLKLARSFGERQIGASRSVVSTRGPAIRYFSDDKGRVLSEEERAKESMYIQKMERERLEKKKKLEQDKLDGEKGSANKKPETNKP